MRLQSTALLVTVALAQLLCLLPLEGAQPKAQPQPTPPRALIALSKTDHALAIVDPATLKIVARVPIGPDPHEVIVSADGRTAYVSNTGSGRFHEINVVDLIAQKERPNIDTGALLGPHGLALADGKVWFTAEGAKSVGRYDPVAAKIDWAMGTGQDRTHMLHVNPDGKRIYATNVDSGSVSVLEHLELPPIVPPTGALPAGAKPRMDWVQTVIPVGKGAEGFDISPNGTELWTADARDGTLSVIDLATKKVTATVDAKVLGANRLKFTPDGKRVAVSSLRSGDLVIYDAATRKELKKLNLGRGAAGLLMDTAEPRVFVSCTLDDYVAVVDLEKLVVTSRLDVGGRPDGLAWAVRPEARGK